MKTKIGKIFTTLILMFIFIIVGIIFSSEVQAWMPPTLVRTNSTTGIFPQPYLADRAVVLPGERYNFTTTQWVANVTGGYIHCGDLSAAIRTGKFDPKKYYIDDVAYTISIPDQVAAIVEFSGATSGGTVNIDGQQVTYTGNNTYSVSGNIDQSHWIIESFYREGSPEYTAQAAMQYILSILAGVEKITPYSGDIDPVRIHGAWDGDAVYGPKVGVMETGTRAGDGYAKVSSATFASSSSGGVDAQVAYALTILEDAYGTLSQTYTREDMQTAFWMLVDPDGKESLKPSYLTANGKVLYEKTLEYSQFLQETSGGYKVTVNSEDAQVIADQSNKEYIVGPFTVIYPEYEDISYIKGMSIISGGNQLIIDEQHNDFEVICKGGATTNPGSNGISKIYPKSEEPFFIKFSASQLGNPTRIELQVKCEYLASCSVNYDKYESVCNVYQYMGHTTTDGEYPMNQGTLVVSMPYTYKKWEVVGSHDESCGCNKIYGTKLCPSCGHNHLGTTCSSTIKVNDYDWVTHSGVDKVSTDIVQPYVQMKETPVDTTKGQRLFATTGGQRTYQVVEAKTSVDLTFSLGGTVWVDAKGGKESIGDSNYGSGDTPMSGVPVTLYSSGGGVVATAVTDGNGSYRFSGLNAMSKYYVKFKYNAQYYQPVEYVAPYGGNWTVNSNGTDVRSERETINARFASIGSTPENYTGQNGKNKTYTREELEAAGAIDKFGNLTGGNSSMQQFVKDCQLESVTGKGGIDLYPVENVFVIDTMQNQLSRTIISASPIYPKLYCINQGYTAREESDLAISKDVEKVTLEINGQVHEYNYDTLDKFKCNNCSHVGKNEDLLLTNKDGVEDGLVHCPTCYSTDIEQTWDIDVRLSDLYYNQDYSRELYKSDYLYKASMYNGIEGKSEEDELEVYITYKIMIRNQALSIQARIDEIVDYYDKDLTYVADRSYIQIKRGDNKGKYTVQADYNESTEQSNTQYGNNTRTTIEGYNNLYIKGLGKGAQVIDDKGNKVGNPIADGIYLKAGQTAYVYLTFNVKKEEKNGEDWVKLDEIIATGSTKISDSEYDVGKENIVEINGYSTRYAPGTQVPNVGNVGLLPAGIIDKDSNPGNLNPNDVPKNSQYENKDDDKYENFEDDTDKAPNIRIVLNRDDESTRVISGSVWEDTRTQEIDVTATGDGFKDENGTLIDGVTVQLVEILESGQEYVWREFGNIDGSTGTKGGSGTVSSEYPIINAIVSGNDIRIVKITEVPQLAEGETLFVENYEFGENQKGAYAFKSFMPGKYIVRFIYGDTEKTVLPQDLTVEGLANGLNVKSYNGQDYKSTTYQKGVEQHVVDQNGNVTSQNTTYTWRKDSTWVNGQEIIPGDELTVVSTFKDDASNNQTVSATLNAQNQKGYLYDITASDAQTNVSDAKDIMIDNRADLKSREDVMNYSSESVTNYIAEVLASHKSDYTTMNDRAQLLKELMSDTKMTAETGLMVIELEYDREETDGQKENNTSTYKIQNVDLGLEERPKAQLAIDKEVTNVKVTLADGSILFDAKNTATNVLWRDHESYNEDESGKEGKIAVYDGNVMDRTAFENIAKIRENNASKFGLIQLSMDEELMHGATMEITYQITVSNVGEVDYKDNLFYYTGVKSANAQVVTTKANQVIDYVANNLQFNANNNSNWSVIKQQDLISNDAKTSLVNKDLESQVEKYNTVITTDKLSADLVPNLYKEKVNKNAADSVSVPLVLTQLITSENDSDDLTYENIVEIVKTSNTVGRRMEFSVVGNQDPEEQPQELDSDIAEVVRILPPFGNAGIYIIITIIAITAIAIIVVGIIFIKKKVLRK